MRKRRGSNYWPGELGKMINQYSPGDIVIYSLMGSGASSFKGVVKEVDTRINKVVVAWGGGALSQHDPDEIMPFDPSVLNSKKASDVKEFSRRARNLSKKEIVAIDEFSVAEFIRRYFIVSNHLNIFHWQTHGYARHEAFGDSYESLYELMDEFVEGYQGVYGRVEEDISDITISPYDEDLVSEIIDSYRDYLIVFKSELGEEDGSLGNILDEMVAVLDKLLYLMTLE